MTPPEHGRSAADEERLRRWYRRLLTCYPRVYRQVHEEEMLGVLLAGAGGRRRPTVAEAVDLVLGSLRIRAQQLARSFPGSTDAQALAVVSVLVPALLLAGAAPGLHEIAWWLRYDGISFAFLQTFPQAPGWAVWLVAAVLGMAGWRRSAAVAACLAAITLTLLLTTDIGNDLYGTQDPPWVLLAALGAVALTASAGARQGLAWLGGPRYAAVVVACGLVAAAHLLGHGYMSAYSQSRWLLPLVVILACRPSTRIGRRVLTLLALPGTAYLVTLLNPIESWITGYGLACLLYGLLLIATRHTNRPQPT